MERRKFIVDSCLALAAGAALGGCRTEGSEVGKAEAGLRMPEGADAERNPGGDGATLGDWEEVRGQFALNPDYIHLSALLIASHPGPVRSAIDGFRREIDEDPIRVMQGENGARRGLALEAAARYLGAEPGEIALTESTTMGLGLVYNGLRLAAGDEVLTTEHDYYVTHESLRLASLRTGARIRKVRLYRNPEDASAEGVVDAVAGALKPATRVLALTWVHSGTGLKLPLKEIGAVVAQANAKRPEKERILFCVDGVHGFGVEDFAVSDLGCDFFITGCHKWLFGPRGTGLVWGSGRGWKSVAPTIPSFIDGESWEAWRNGGSPDGATTARRLAPGGFKAFEHQWALPAAFSFHEGIGRRRVAERTHALNRQLMEGLARTPRVRLHTPRREGMSSGIACFSLEGMDPFEAVGRLREKRVIATVTPYAERYVRLTPSIANLPSEIDRALAALRDVA